MWHLGTWVSGGLGRAAGIGALNDLKVFPNLKDSVTPYSVLSKEFFTFVSCCSGHALQVLALGFPRISLIFSILTADSSLV